jgi:hypothetical protein
MDNRAPELTLARLTVAPALIVIAWFVVALPLLLAGAFTIGPALVLFVPVLAVTLFLGFRGTRRDSLRAARPASWWAVAGVLAVAVGFMALQLAMCSEQIVVRRDPATYVQFANWLTEHGSLPISQFRWAFGGSDPALSFGSPGFYQRGTTLVPQFMAGNPLILALGGWIGGTYAMLAMAPIMGAAAVLSFGGLTARLVGPRWAPLGALALALALPMQWISRSTYSEIPAMILLFGGLSLMHDVRELDPDPAAGPIWRQPVRVRAALAGLAFGLIVLVRIDGLRDIMPVVVFAGLLIARGRRRTGLPLFLGLLAGAAAGLIEAYTLSRPYLHDIQASLSPLLAMLAALTVSTVFMVTLLLWRDTGDVLRGLGRAMARSRIPDLAAGLTVLVMIGFALRPYFQKDVRMPRTDDDKLNASLITLLQKANHLPVEYGRQYTELSLYWVVWYIGVPALLLATFGAALMARRLLRLPGSALAPGSPRRSAEWILPYAVIVWTTVLTLIRPGITPDHPWAGRRLISIVIPGLLLFALWALAWATRQIRRLGYGRAATAGAALLGALVVAVPIVWVSAALMFSKTEQGEVAAVNRLCSAIGPGASVLVVERVTADWYSAVIRNQCGIPVGRVRVNGNDVADPADVQRLVKKINAAGRRPVVLGHDQSQVSGYGPSRQVLSVHTRKDGQTLTHPPRGTWSLTLSIWMAEPDGPS